MKGCRHEEDLEIITALYKERYYGGGEGFKMYEPERLPGAETIETEAEANMKAAYEVQKAEKIKELQSKRSEAESEVAKIKIETEAV